MLESHVEQLEGRILRREKELQGAVEESKAAGRVERARLESLHRQEMREKDEQVLRFKTELEALIYELRQQQQTFQ